MSKGFQARKSTNIPQPYGNLLGYQSVNVIDPSFGDFMRNFVIDDYYLTVYGTKHDNMHYRVQYTKKYADGRTIWYDEVLQLNQINELLDYLENLDRLTEQKMAMMDAIHQAKVDEQIKEHKDRILQLSKEIPPAKMRNRE